MIKLKEKKAKKGQKPYYKLKINYMIGDADGYTSEEGEFKVQDADVIEKFCRILDKLKPLKGSWGIMLNEMDSHFAEGHITEDELNFWDIVATEDYEDEDFEKVKELNPKHEAMFQDLISAETEYSFLVYEDYKLSYYDEKGLKHNTYFED